MIFDTSSSSLSSYSIKLSNNLSSALSSSSPLLFSGTCSSISLNFAEVEFRSLLHYHQQLHLLVDSDDLEDDVVCCLVLKILSRIPDVDTERLYLEYILRHTFPTFPCLVLRILVRRMHVALPSLQAARPLVAGRKEELLFLAHEIATPRPAVFHTAHYRF